MKHERLLSDRQIFFLFAGFAAVYISGLLVPLMENDSAQHASMAMRMVLTGDFLHIYKGENPYLDKPHLHFWLSALSMKLFGINAVAYRLPALLCLAIAAFSAKKIAELLYENTNLGNLAALIFLSAQTIILSAHDVRTDAVLTGFIGLGIWQILKFIKTQKSSTALLGGLATALAFSSKGMMAVVIIGFCILSYLLYSKEWKQFFNLKFFLIVTAFIVGILPVLYAYYVQFGAEGIQFILFSQSVNRLNGNGFEETSPDYIFFFHTLLWAFLPFSLAFYTGVFNRTAWFIRHRFRKENGVEFLTLGGFWLVMLLFSFSKFKLPHYLNGLIAVLAVFTSASLFYLFRKKDYKTVKILYIIQLIVIFASIAGVGLLVHFFTDIPNILMYCVDALLFAFILFYVFKRENLLKKYVFISLLFAIAVNVFLNTQFYPVLTQYQGGLKLAQFVNTHKIPKDKIYMPHGYEPWSFDFYTQRNTPRINFDEIKKGDYLLVNEGDLKNIRSEYQVIDTENAFRITRLSLPFLNPKTRASKLDKVMLVKILN